MRRTFIVATALFLFLLLHPSGVWSMQAAGGQRPATDDEPINPAAIQRRFRPKLSLQKALQLAENYIETEHIDISSYWLYRAKFILSGDTNTPDKEKLPCWHFWWVNDDGSMGDYVEIMVTMDGKVWRAVSM
jgi:hypothetical protein